MDDDRPFRESLESLFRSIGLKATSCASAAEFLRMKLPDGPHCLVLDVRLPDMSGLELQARLVGSGVDSPIIVTTGHGDIPMTVRAMKAGAVDFLTKPFRDQDMLDAVCAALALDRARRDSRKAATCLHRLYDALTPREKQVMALVTSGLMNKQVASEIGLSEITVKVHRRNLMRKMRAHSLPELVRMAEAVGIGH